MAVLAARARQAFFEYNPLPIFGDDPERIYRSIPMGPLVEVFALDMRTYKGANTENRQPALDASSAVFGAGAAAVAEGVAEGEQGDVEDRRRRSAARPHRRRRRRTATRRSPTASRARRSDASSRSPICCAT